MATVEFTTAAALYTGHGGEVMQVGSTEVGVEFGQALRTTDSPQFEGLTLLANLVVEGDVTLNAGLLVANDTIFSATVDVEGALNVSNKNLILDNVGTPTDVTADGGGIVLFGDTSSDKTILWVNAIKAWTFNQDVAVQKQLSVGALTAPTTDASIDLKATNKALLLNQLTTAQRNALTPVARMVIYNTDTDQVEFFNGAVWQAQGGGDASGPALSVNNTVVRFNGASGKNLQSSDVVIDDSDNMTGVNELHASTIVDETIYAQLSSSVDQIPSDTNPTVITYNVQDAINGLTHSTTVNAGEITIDTAGIYFVSPQPQVGKDSGAVKTDFDMFLQVDVGSGFVDTANSNIKLTIKDSDITDVVVLAITIQLAVGDKIRMMQRVSNSAIGMGLKNTVAVVGPPTVPRTPSIIFTMYRVGGVPA